METIVAQSVANCLVAVELAVHHYPHIAVAVGNGLCAVVQPDDRQPGVAEKPAAVVADPLAGEIGPAVRKAGKRPVDVFRIDGTIEQSG